MAKNRTMGISQIKKNRLKAAIRLRQNAGITLGLGVKSKVVKTLIIFQKKKKTDEEEGEEEEMEVLRREREG